ncbi:MAG TPA: helix-turn-helix transcriptional regulator [Ignavibacteria bacterium]|nr:helix-turn-helix transcriptional regulator [Ignavibacteria bacterium]
MSNFQEHQYSLNLLGNKRDKSEAEAKYFVIGKMLKYERKAANLTQEELANKIGTKKS